MLVPLSSSLSALLSALDSEKMCRGQTTAGAEDLTLKRETAAGLFAYRLRVVGRVIMGRLWLASPQKAELLTLSGQVLITAEVYALPGL